jgi:hypothetical protein
MLPFFDVFCQLGYPQVILKVFAVYYTPTKKPREVNPWLINFFARKNITRYSVSARVLFLDQP